MRIKSLLAKIINVLKNSNQPQLNAGKVKYEDVGIFNSVLPENIEEAPRISSHPEQNIGRVDNDPPVSGKRPEMGIVDPLSPEETPRDPNAIVHVLRTPWGREVDFTYRLADLESYVINEATSAAGGKITYFERIPEIRAKDPSERTKAEADLLEEFDNMMNYVISAGEEYGVDPKYILAIIQREVCFKGMSENVVGKNGKGYMQITSAAPADMLARPHLYNPEAGELLASRGFDIDCPKSQRDAMVKKIMAYLKKNEDPEFNIRMGVLSLRHQLNKANGNFQIAAKNYNGSSAKEAYGKGVKNNYDAISVHKAQPAGDNTEV